MSSSCRRGEAADLMQHPVIVSGVSNQTHLPCCVTNRCILGLRKRRKLKLRISFICAPLSCCCRFSLNVDLVQIVEEVAFDKTHKVTFRKVCAKQKVH